MKKWLIQVQCDVSNAIWKIIRIKAYVPFQSWWTDLLNIRVVIITSNTTAVNITTAFTITTTAIAIHLLTIHCKWNTWFKNSESMQTFKNKIKKWGPVNYPYTIRKDYVQSLTGGLWKIYLALHVRHINNFQQLSKNFFLDGKCY